MTRLTSYGARLCRRALHECVSRGCRSCALAHRLSCTSCSCWARHAALSARLRGSAVRVCIDRAAWQGLLSLAQGCSGKGCLTLCQPGLLSTPGFLRMCPPVELNESAPARAAWQGTLLWGQGYQVVACHRAANMRHLSCHLKGSKQLTRCCAWLPAMPVYSLLTLHVWCRLRPHGATSFLRPRRLCP